jgi:hypothetical protein
MDLLQTYTVEIAFEMKACLFLSPVFLNVKERQLFFLVFYK